MEAKNVVATWISVDQEDQASWFPQVGRISSSDPRVHNVYWRCVATYFATAYKLFKDKYRLVLYTPAYLPEPQVGALLAQWNVEVRVCAMAHMPPPGYFEGWRNQFYILDIIKDLADRNDGAAAIVLDSDCVFTGSLETLFELVQREDALTYDVGEDEGTLINGLTRVQMGELFSVYGYPHVPEPGGVPRYYGGEFFAASALGLQRLATAMTPVWQKSLELFEAGKPKFNEEAHFLSFLYYRLSIKAGTAAAFGKRFWTGFRHRTGQAGDQLKLIWHVPAEKKYGLATIYRDLLQPDSWFWVLPPDKGWLRKMRSLLGVPRPSLVKMFQEIASKVLVKAKLRQEI